MSRDRLQVVAVGVAACVGCCAAPILGALGITVGLAAVAWLAFGVLAAGLVAAGGAVVIRRRRRVAA